jgi:hypothetical protein
MGEKRRPIDLSGERTSAPRRQRSGSSDADFEQVTLLSRLALGALLIGGDEVIRRVQQAQQTIEAEPDPAGDTSGNEEETAVDLLRYLGIGLLAQSQRRMARRVRRGYFFSRGVTNTFFETLNWATDNPIARPIRRPIEARLIRLAEEVGRVVNEGRLEERQARRLTSEALNETVDEVFVTVSDSPEIEELIRRVIGQQSAGLASIVVSNTRKISLSADDLAEGIVRRLVRRKPRSALPPSPLVGKPQTMYGLDEKEKLLGPDSEGGVAADLIQ